jgi:hypothetical protein
MTNPPKKYELTDESITDRGITFYRVRALRDIPMHGVKKGDLGGFVESEANFSQIGECWLGGDAKVAGSAIVSGNMFAGGGGELIAGFNSAAEKKQQQALDKARQEKAKKDEAAQNEHLEEGLEKKYQLTDETIEIEGVTLHRIRALRDIPRYRVTKGDLGGFIESEYNLSHKGDCWVAEDAKIARKARVFGDGWSGGPGMTVNGLQQNLGARPA